MRKVEKVCPDPAAKSEEKRLFSQAKRDSVTQKLPLPCLFFVASRMYSFSMFLIMEIEDYYMAARRYEISLEVLNYFATERSEQVKYFSA